MSIPKKINYKKIALVLSLCAIFLWSVLGAGTSLAWFADTDEEVVNIFHFGEFDLSVSQKQPDGSYKEIETDTKIFDEKALYEPGYVQIVYLKIENKGTVPFDFKTAVSVRNYVPGTNVFGGTFYLQEHLMFGIVTANSSDELEEMLKTREKAKNFAQMPLNNYTTDSAPLNAGDSVYMAIIVRMPEEVGNVANYRDNQPYVELGVIIKADQQKK